MVRHEDPWNVGASCASHNTPGHVRSLRPPMGGSTAQTSIRLMWTCDVPRGTVTEAWSSSPTIHGSPEFVENHAPSLNLPHVPGVSWHAGSLPGPPRDARDAPRTAGAPRSTPGTKLGRTRAAPNDVAKHLGRPQSIDTAAGPSPDPAQLEVDGIRVPLHRLRLRALHRDHRQGQGQLLLDLVPGRPRAALHRPGRGDPLAAREGRTGTPVPAVPEGGEALRPDLPTLRHRALPARPPRRPPPRRP